MYSVVVYQKYLTRLGEMIIFSQRLENYQFSEPRQIFLIYGNTIYVFSINDAIELKAFAENKKGENAESPPPPPHTHTMFSGAFFFRVVKTGNCVLKD